MTIDDVYRPIHEWLATAEKPWFRHVRFDVTTKEGGLYMASCYLVEAIYQQGIAVAKVLGQATVSMVDPLDVVRTAFNAALSDLKTKRTT